MSRFNQLDLSEAEVRGRIHAREAGRIDNETYRELNGVETLKASQQLRRLRDADLLEQQEKGRCVLPRAGQSVTKLTIWPGT